MSSSEVTVVTQDTTNINVVLDTNSYTLDINTTSVVVDVQPTSTIPSVLITTADQGPEGVKGDKGEKGDPLTYSSLTPSEKQDIIYTYDNVVGSTSYANIFLNTLLN